MPARILVDEHVPRVVSTTLESNGNRVERADEVFGEGTVDEALLAWCDENDRLLPTNDEKDFHAIASEHPHSGVFIYANQVWARDSPSEIVHVIEEVLGVYGREGLRGQVVWLDQWSHLV